MKLLNNNAMQLKNQPAQRKIKKMTNNPQRPMRVTINSFKLDKKRNLILQMQVKAFVGDRDLIKAENLLREATNAMKQAENLLREATNAMKQKEQGFSPVFDTMLIDFLDIKVEKLDSVEISSIVAITSDGREIKAPDHTDTRYVYYQGKLTKGTNYE
jgi:hypothetical protein